MGIHSTSKESSTNNNMEADLVAKVVSMCILGGISLLLGLLPIKLNEKYNLREEKNGSRVTTIKQLVITALNCFGAGVILTTCFGHMLPEANEAIKGSGIKDKGLALGNVFMICGFLMIYIVEELAHVILHKLKDDHHTQKLEIHDEDHWENPLQISNNPEKKLQLEPTPSPNSSAMSSKDECIHGDYAHEELKLGIIIPDNFQAAFRGFMVVVAILQALAAGTLVYVVFFEVLEKERVKKHNLGSKKQLWCQLYGVIQVSFISLGFIIMILVQLLEGEHHHHSSEALELFSICEINPEEVFKDVSTKLANVTCIDGEFNIL